MNTQETSATWARERQQLLALVERANIALANTAAVPDVRVPPAAPR